MQRLQQQIKFSFCHGWVWCYYTITKKKIKQLTPTKDKRKFKERGKNFFQA
jgi:hypothetical protein